MSDLRKRALELARKRVQQQKELDAKLKKTSQKKEPENKEEPKKLSFLEIKKQKELEQRQKERERLQTANRQLEEKIKEGKQQKIKEEKEKERKTEAEKQRKIEEKLRKKIEEENKQKELEKQKRLEKEQELIERNKKHKKTKKSKKSKKSTLKKKKIEKVTHQESIPIPNQQSMVSSEQSENELKNQNTGALIKLPSMNNESGMTSIVDLRMESLLESEIQRGLKNVEEFLNDNFIDRNVNRVKLYQSNNNPQERIDREQIIISRENEDEVLEFIETDYTLLEDNIIKNGTETKAENEIEIETETENGIKIANTSLKMNNYFIQSLKSLDHIFYPNNFIQLSRYRDEQVLLFRNKHKGRFTAWISMVHSNFEIFTKTFEVLKFKADWVEIRATKHILDIKDAELKDVIFDLLYFGLVEFNRDEDAVKLNELGNLIASSNDEDSLKQYIIDFFFAENLTNALIYRIHSADKKYPADTGDLGKILVRVIGKIIPTELKKMEKGFILYLESVGIGKLTKKGTKGKKTRFFYLTQLGVKLLDRLILKKSFSNNEGVLFYQEKVISKHKCPECNRSIHSSYVICPYCSHSLQKICIRCRRIVEKEWKICAFCSAVIKLN
ncbi:MAG: hypothetical protein GY870_16990 [archaeon]|nr:hypothetical protein [archaeon]